MKTHIYTFILGSVLLFALVAAAPVQAQEEDESLEDIIAELQERIAELEEQIADMQGEEEDDDDEDEDENDLSDQEDEEEDDEEGSANGRPNGLPEQASDRAHHVQACIQIGRTLRRGDAGEEVEQLQQVLKEQGHFDFDRITGYYGQITEDAVKRFQEAEGIVSQGNPRTTGFGQMGPRTRAAFGKVSCLRDGGVPDGAENDDADDDTDSEEEEEENDEEDTDEDEDEEEEDEDDDEETTDEE